MFYYIQDRLLISINSITYFIEVIMFLSLIIFNEFIGRIRMIFSHLVISRILIIKSTVFVFFLILALRLVLLCICHPALHAYLYALNAVAACILPFLAPAIPFIIIYCELLHILYHTSLLSSIATVLYIYTRTFSIRSLCAVFSAYCVLSWLRFVAVVLHIFPAKQLRALDSPRILSALCTVLLVSSAFLTRVYEYMHFFA